MRRAGGGGKGGGEGVKVNQHTHVGLEQGRRCCHWAAAAGPGSHKHGTTAGTAEGPLPLPDRHSPSIACTPSCAGQAAQAPQPHTPGGRAGQLQNTASARPAGLVLTAQFGSSAMRVGVSPRYRPRTPSSRRILDSPPAASSAGGRSGPPQCGPGVCTCVRVCARVHGHGGGAPPRIAVGRWACVNSCGRV